MIMSQEAINDSIQKLNQLSNEELHFLNECIIDQLRTRARRAACSFNSGDRVQFIDNKSGIIWEGCVTVIKTKNITVSCDKPYLKNWLVSANLLKKI